MKNIKYSSIILSLVLILSVLPVVLADDSFQESDVIGSDNVEIVTDLQEADDSMEVQELLEDDDLNEDGALHVWQVTYGRGFIVKDDESNADVFRGLWIADRMVENAAITDAASANISLRRFGYIMLGAGERHEKFKLEMTSFSNESVSFNVLNSDGNTAGTLELKPKKYTWIKLWFGTLTLNEGNYAGTWSVSAIANTRIVKPKIEKPAWWNIFAGNQRKRAEIQEQIQERILQNEGLSDDAIAEVKANAGENIGEKVKTTVQIKRAERLETAKKIHAENSPETDSEDNSEDDSESNEE